MNRSGTELLRQGTGVAGVAGEVFVGRVDVEERVPGRAEFRQFFTAALGQNGMAGVAVAGAQGAFVKVATMLVVGR